MTGLGTDAPNVIGHVYIAAFGLDQGESIGALLSQGPPTPALAHLIFHKQASPGYQRTTWSTKVMGAPAWKSLPSWYMIAAGDQAIPLEAKRQFAK